jgi:hypothetical protein
VPGVEMMGYRKIGFLEQIWYVIKYAVNRRRRRKEGKNGKAENR